MANLIHVRVVCANPDETVTLRLKSSFTSTPGGAHQRIQVALVEGHNFAVPVEGEDVPREFTADQMRELMVW